MARECRVCGSPHEPKQQRCCRVCSLPHDPGIHQATLNAHAFLNAELERKLAPLPFPVKRKDKKHTDLVVNFANGPVSRRHGYQSTGDGEARGL